MCPALGYDADTLADTLAGLIVALDLRGATLVSHSMGSGEIMRYLARTARTGLPGSYCSRPPPPCC